MYYCFSFLCSCAYGSCLSSFRTVPILFVPSGGSLFCCLSLFNRAKPSRCMQHAHAPTPSNCWRWMTAPFDPCQLRSTKTCAWIHRNQSRIALQDHWSVPQYQNVLMSHSAHSHIKLIRQLLARPFPYRHSALPLVEPLRPHSPQRMIPRFLLGPLVW